MLNAKFIFSGLMVLGLVTTGGRAGAQQLIPVESAAPKVVRMIPGPVPQRPFAADSATKPRSIEWRASGQMNADDRTLLERSWPAIVAGAGLAGVSEAQSGWQLQQFLCPSFPNHLLLRLSQANHSELTVALARTGQDAARVIPLSRRGLSLLDPAAVNPLSIAAFNHLRQREATTVAPDWLELGLCYAALTGAPPQSAADGWALLEVAPRGATVHFAGPGASDGWALLFGADGSLLKVVRAPVAGRSAKPIPPANPKPNWTVLPPTVNGPEHLAGRMLPDPPR
jgi:hypothetical protein